MFRRELLRGYSELRREGNFPGSKLSGFAPAVFGTPQRREFPSPRIHLEGWKIYRKEEKSLVILLENLFFL
jgi:hypothetical protein